MESGMQIRDRFIGTVSNAPLIKLRRASEYRAVNTGLARC